MKKGGFVASEGGRFQTKRKKLDLNLISREAKRRTLMKERTECEAPPSMAIAPSPGGVKPLPFSELLFI